MLRKTLSISALTVGAFAAPILEANNFKPNILLINIDDLGVMDVGFNNSKKYDTPNIDKLASMGVTFENSYASAANCAPSRASLLTSQYPVKHGILTVGNSERGSSKERKIIPIPTKKFLGQKFTTIANILKDAGYTTCHIGKFHVSGDPLKFGFMKNIGGSYAGAPASYFSPYKNKALVDGPKGEHLPTRLTTEAINFMNESKDDPFFLYLAYYSVHTPLQGRKDLIEKYSKDKRLLHEKQVTYAAMLHALDENIGRLNEFLTANKMWDNTIVIFTSDNGGLYSFSPQTPYRAGKGSYYEGGVRVPLSISYGNGEIPKGVRLDERVSQLDLLPTLCALADVKIDESKFDGLDISDYLKDKNKSAELEDRILCFYFPVYLQKYPLAITSIPESMRDRDPLFRTRPGTSIYSGDYKLIKYYEDENDFELFNLKDDISEQVNLADKLPEVRDELYKKMQEYLTKNSAKIPTKLNPKYKGKK